jgi:hypothetical protein
MLLAALPVACGPAAVLGSGRERAPTLDTVAVPPRAVPVLPPAAPADVVPEPACTADGDCGYDPAGDRCRADPRANRQPPLVDQGIVCYCAEARCAALRVAPVPCESDASCAVSVEPRPHPIAAGKGHLHERGKPCRDFVFSTTCERTNICTMRSPRCPRP